MTKRCLKCLGKIKILINKFQLKAIFLIRLNNELTNEIYNLKKDYLSTLQSFFTCKILSDQSEKTYLASSKDNESGINELFRYPLNSYEARLFGGNKVCLHAHPLFLKLLIYFFKHKNRLKSLLEESRKSDPSLPSWESLSGMGSYVDNYGFKYDKENDSILMQYVCQQLNLFYDRYPKMNEEVAWRTTILRLEDKFSKTVYDQKISLFKFKSNTLIFNLE